MSWLGSIFGGGVGETAQGIGSLAKDVEDLFGTSDREALSQYRAETERMEVQQRTDMAQNRVNEAQANHPSLFVAGARPFIMWVCGIAMAYHFLAYPLFGELAESMGYPLVDLEWEELSVVLMGMLGFGGMRAYEKTKGVARDNLQPQGN